VPDLIGDLRDAGFGSTVARFAADHHGRLDGVVNAAGIVAFGEHVDTDPVVLEELFLVNALGPLWLARGVADSLAATSGFFVNISGVVAETPYPGMVAYVASKSAASAGVRSLAREWRRRRILVVDARPPHTETGLAGRPLAGVAPRFPQGLDPRLVAERIVAAVEAGETEVPSTAFG
jgi:cyclic-di-GMP-binding biofilm dispersal mediator protein